jgi:hypothetical protein
MASVDPTSDINGYMYLYLKLKFAVYHDGDCSSSSAVMIWDSLELYFVFSVFPDNMLLKGTAYFSVSFIIFYHILKRFQINIMDLARISLLNYTL